MNDFWIGDWVKDPKTGEFGTYEGLENEKALVKINDEICHIPLNRLVLISDKEVEAIRMNERTAISDHSGDGEVEKIAMFQETLDLHIEKLAPHLKNSRTELILNKQLKAANDHIVQAISRRQHRIVLIHGKGKGVLKMEIEHLLDDFEEVFFRNPVHDGGAIEALFKYF